MSVMGKLLEINDELVKVRAERDDLIETVRLKDEQIEMLNKELIQAYDERGEAWKERDQAIERERCLLNELNVVKDNLSHHLKLVQQQQLAVTIGTYWTPSLDDLRLKGD